MLIMDNKIIYKVISTGSKNGNCEYINNGIIIDIGVPFKKIQPYLKNIKIILLSHCHKDHFNIKTLQKIQYHRPGVRVACGEWMMPYLKDIVNIDILKLNKWYNYKIFRLSIGKLYHDVENCFFRIDIQGYKIFRATDTKHLMGITAQHYDLYAIEHNYNECNVNEAIERAQGKFTRAHTNKNTHLSTKQAREFIIKNRKKDSKVIQLHKSNEYY